jgi:hypothetical protein
MSYVSTIGSGGKNRSVCQRLKDTGSAYSYLDKLLDTVAATPSPENAAIILNLKAETAPTRQDDGTIKIGYTQFDCGENFYEALDVVAVPDDSSGEIKEQALEDGVKIFGAGASGEKVLMVDVLHANSLANPTKRLVQVSFGHIAPSSGSSKHKSGEGVQPTFDFVGEKLLYDLVVPATLFPADLVTGEAVTIKAGKCFASKWMAIPA